MIQEPSSANAQTSDSYVWQFSSPQNISNTADLQSILDEQMAKMISSGLLAPFRTLYGELIPHYSYVRPYDAVYTLSLVYPYVTTERQTQLATYLKNELRNYPIWYNNPNNWGAPILDPQIGTKREPETIPDDRRTTEYSAQRWTYKDFPRLFGLYGLWLYAQNTGDWQYIDSR